MGPIAPKTVLDYRFRGLAHAGLVLGLWLASIAYALLFFEFSPRTWWVVPFIVLWIAFLYTGLFITAHDAMHRSLMPKDPFANDLVGRAAVFLFALFSYSKLKAKHGRHHEHPATDMDPDYHDGRRRGFWAWYRHFMWEYVTWRQPVGMGVAFCALWLALGVRPENLILFWALPAILSSLQLFAFGTYLPHREPKDGYRDQHRATTSGYSRFVSFLTCYHFGYHWEHHEYPYIPWWKLGRMRKDLAVKSAARVGQT